MGRLAKKRHLENDITTEFGHLPLDEIKQIHIDKFKTKLLKGTKATRSTKKREAVSIKTVNNILTPLGTLLRYAVANDVISAFKLNFPEDESEIESISPEDFAKLLGTWCEIHHIPRLSLGRNAGLRIGEIRALRWCDVDERNKRITIRAAYDTAQNLKGTKNRRIRKVPLEKTLLGEMKLLMPTDCAEWAGKSTLHRNHAALHAHWREGQARRPSKKAKQEAITQAFESSWRKRGADENDKEKTPAKLLT